jgi:2-amino-4-hydroxy-6-hydroxymethyldihydropteridine diphosphokinase
MHNAYIALGTNLGNKRRNLQSAIREIAESVGTLSAVSSVHTSEPWGYASKNAFLNQVIRIRTALSPIELLHALQNIEKQLGRTPKTTQGYEDRIIDLDIILYDQLSCQSEELTIPHPHYRQRPFVLNPLREIIEKQSNHTNSSSDKIFDEREDDSCPTELYF